MFEIFYDLFRDGGPEDQQIPLQFQRIIRETLDLKNDIEFGYAVDRSQMGYNELVGSRAYQRALNRIEAERAKRREQEAPQQ